jgi:hypothetical protein
MKLPSPSTFPSPSALNVGDATTRPRKRANMVTYVVFILRVKTFEHQVKDRAILSVRRSVRKWLKWISEST